LVFIVEAKGGVGGRGLGFWVEGLRGLAV